MKRSPLSTFSLPHIPSMCDAFLITQVIEHSGRRGGFNILVNTKAHSESPYFKGN